MLAGLAERDRGLESGTGGGGLLGLPPLIAAPGADGGDDEHGERDQIDAVAVPQLLELIAPDFLVDLVKDVSHELLHPRRFVRVPPQAPADCARNLTMWRRQGKDCAGNR